MSVKLLTKHHLELEAAQARLSLHLTKCHIVGKSHVTAQLIYRPLAPLGSCTCLKNHFAYMEYIPKSRKLAQMAMDHLAHFICSYGMISLLVVIQCYGPKICST